MYYTTKQKKKRKEVCCYSFLKHHTSVFMAGYLGVEATDDKPYIFISYNKEDQERLSGIMQILKKTGLSIWYDNGIKRVSDEEWQEQIAIHIKEAEILFFFISNGIFQKLDSFVRKEYDLAVRHDKKMCIVLLDKIDDNIIPAKYDFWWGEIKNRQNIHAYEMTDEDISEKIWKECCKQDEFKQYEKLTKKKYYLADKDGRHIELISGVQMIGRSARKCDVVVDDNYISGVHACIIASDDSVYIKDLNSMSGTLVNGNIINPQVEVFLKIGDVIKIGQTEFCLGR